MISPPITAATAPDHDSIKPMPEPAEPAATPTALPPRTIPAGWIQEVHQQSINRYLRQLGIELIYHRGLPPRHFRKYLAQEAVPPAEAAKINPRRWVSPNGQIRLTDYQDQLLALTVLLHIKIDLSHEPPGETYEAALNRMREQARALVSQKVPKTRLAKQLELDFKTVSALLSADYPNSRLRLDPWAILSRIRDSDWGPRPRQPKRRQPETDGRHGLTDSEVWRSRARDRNARQVGWQDETNLPLVTKQGRCHHCGAGKANLVPAGYQAPQHLEFWCRLCGRSSYVKIPASQIKEMGIAS